MKSKYYGLAKVVLMAVDKHGISTGMVFKKKQNVKLKLDVNSLAGKSESHCFAGIQVRKGTLKRLHMP